MRFTIDSNILVYAYQDIDIRSHISRSILDALPGLDVVFTTQALGEFLNVVRRKNRQELPIAIEAVGLWSLVYPCASTQPDDLQAAIRLAERYKLQLWDSVILTVARASDVELMLNEDMQDGALYDGIGVMNPFLPANSAALDTLLMPAS